MKKFFYYSVVIAGVFLQLPLHARLTRQGTKNTTGGFNSQATNASGKVVSERTSSNEEGQGHTASVNSVLGTREASWSKANGRSAKTTDARGGTLSSNDGTHTVTNSSGTTTTLDRNGFAGKFRNFNSGSTTSTTEEDSGKGTSSGMNTALGKKLGYAKIRGNKNTRATKSALGTDALYAQQAQSAEQNSQSNSGSGSGSGDQAQNNLFNALAASLTGQTQVSSNAPKSPAPVTPPTPPVPTPTATPTPQPAPAT